MTSRFFAILAMGAALPVAFAADDPKPQQPVFVLLYSRVYDHMNLDMEQERIFRIIDMAGNLRRQYPQLSPSVVLQLSGAFAEQLDKLNPGLHRADLVRQAIADKRLELGYDGQHEPTYRNRPKPNLKNATTAEQRWLAYSNAAERFLRDYKEQLTGAPDPKKKGGLAYVQELFGPAALISNLTVKIGSDQPVISQLRRLNQNAILWGLPDPDPSRGIHGYRGSVNDIGRQMSPWPNTSPELLWDANVLRTSDTGAADSRAIRGEEGVDKFKELFTKLDRKNVRVIHVEVGTYLRYFNTHPDDNSIRFPILARAYDDPEDPNYPGGVPAFKRFPEVEAAWAAEAQAIEWLCKEFLPANPGSRFVSVADLKAMAADPVGRPVSKDTMLAAVKDLQKRFGAIQAGFPNFAQGGQQFYSAADLFYLLAANLAAWDEKGSFPESVTLASTFGPLVLDMESGPNEGEVTVKEVAQAASGLAGLMSDANWRPVPQNAVPMTVQVGKLKLNSRQFLYLMTEAFLDPQPTRTMPVRIRYGISPGISYPSQYHPQDMGNVWTLRPVVLDLKAVAKN